MPTQAKDFYNKSYLLLGTNQGNRNYYLSAAIDCIQQEIGNILQQSSIYQTKAWGIHNQPDFLNQVIICDTKLDAHKLLKGCQEIEKKLGRKRLIRWGQRTIDIDILYFNENIIATEDLKIPHPEIQNRRFTLIPLVELSPNLVHPLLKKTQKELLESCTDKLQVEKLE